MLTNKIAKACLFGGALSLSVLGSSMAMAANQQSYNIDVYAHVPSDDFQIEPVESGWINQAQEIEYDITTSKLKAFEKQFQYKNVSGGIQATLMNTDANGKAILSNGTDIIPLKVEFNGVELDDSAQTVVDATAASAGGRTTLRISQDDTQPLTVEGDFTGQVAMIFEEVVTTP
ncbi:CS1 type fimbrial major subunit [Kosakonia pseudosacchari]|uniref:Adhesin n=1 Tax=Kosakonia pseudosacchari TaxID=1646340 RepID=A0ABX4INU3_9ENTR|nr:CS1 type fimbrial major subunit [Kosakonia pseudosacchari]PDO86111.1 adhesin [Kosakonia pseudosacchari]